LTYKHTPKTKQNKSETPLQKNGWTLFAHPALLEQIEKLEASVGARPEPQSASLKVLKWITDAMFDEIPQDPSRSEYRLGGALSGSTHWFRDKYAGRFRLFFRFSSTVKVIIYGWVNDERTLRTYGSKTDAYTVFKSKLAKGDPPDTWSELLKEASSNRAVARLRGKRPKD